jgi:hypothetical protein
VVLAHRVGHEPRRIANPHWIYPGQIIWFDRAAGRLRLGKQLGEGATIRHAKSRASAPTGSARTPCRPSRRA